MKIPLHNGEVIPKITLKMKVSFILLFFCLIKIHANSYSQNVKITLNENQISVEEFFNKVENLTEYKFLYNLKDINLERKVDVFAERTPLKYVLESVFRNTNVDFTVYENQIILKLNPKVPIEEDPEDQFQVSGTVRDKAGQPLFAVSVFLKHTQRGTTTNEDGYYEILASSNDTIVFNSLGYQEKEIAVGNQRNIDVTLQEKTSSLEEVLVVGYGTTTRRTNTGAVSSVTNQEIENQVVGNPLQAMTGRMAGVNINLNNGLPGSNSTIEIRGNNTLQGLGLSGGLPLYVIDGVPFTNFSGGIPFSDNLNSFGISGANGGISPLSMINPKDIERIDVLKDADATAIYGARGANGVVIITTKKGQEGKSEFNVNYSRGWGEVANFIKLLDTEQYLALRREAFQNDNATPNESNAPDLTLWDQNAYTDFQELLLGGKADISDLQLSYSGGNEYVRYFVSGNYRKNGTVFPGNMGSDRYSGRINLQTNSKNKRFQANVSANYSLDKTNLITTDISSAIFLPPNYPLYQDNGDLYWGGGFTNPLAYLKKTYDNRTENFIFNTDLQYNIIGNLIGKVNVGYSRTWLDQNSQNPISSQDPTTSVNNEARFANSYANNLIIEPQLKYQLEVGKGQLNALLGSTFQDNTSEAVSYRGSNYTYEDLLDIISAAGTISAINNYSEYKYASAFGRLNFNWDTKYIANLTYRRDASSRFGGNNKFANFGAVGMAWIFSNEKFFAESEGLSFINYGKLNASYGTTGNDQIPNYQYLTLYSGSRQIYQDVAPISPGGLANPDLKWETTRKLDIGIDLGLFDNRLLFKTNYYRNISTDLLTYANIPTQTGVNSINTNLDAEVLNTGVEIELSSTNIRTDSFSWESSFNVTFQKNELKSFNEVDKSFYADSFKEGEPINGPVFFDYEGIDPETGEAMYNDLDGEPGLDYYNDRYFADLGTPYYGGFNNTFKYKNLTLGVFTQFTHRKGGTNSLAGSSLGSMNNQNISVLNRWQQPGDTGTLWPGASAVPGSPIYSSYGFYFNSSDFFYGDASFIKIRNVNLDYQIPQSAVSQLGIKKLNIYVQGQNLLTFSPNSDYELDPENGFNSSGRSGSFSVPPLRTIVFGLNCTF